MYNTTEKSYPCFPQILCNCPFCQYALNYREDTEDIGHWAFYKIQAMTQVSQLSQWWGLCGSREKIVRIAFRKKKKNYQVSVYFYQPLGNRRCDSHYSWSTVLSLTIASSHFLSLEASENATVTSNAEPKMTFQYNLGPSPKGYWAFTDLLKVMHKSHSPFSMAYGELKANQSFFNSCNHQTLFFPTLSHTLPPKSILQSATFFLNIPWISLCIIKNVALKLIIR